MTSGAWPGRHERELARRLIAGVAEAAASALRWRDVDLATSAEHLLYTALRQPAAPPSRVGLPRALGRVGLAVARARGTRISLGSPMPSKMAVLVTQLIHVDIYRPVQRILAANGIESVIVDADTRRPPSSMLEGAAGHLGAFLRITDAPMLAAHATTVEARLRRIPGVWRRELTPEEAERLLGVLRRGLPLLALDVARTDALLEQLRPAVVVCFSESGLLARVVPAVARRRAMPAVDLPHAEAADPWGTAGAGYDGVAVYGPRSRRVMELAGIPAERIVEIGPLRYDGLLTEQPTEAATQPRRIVFASQPSDPRRPALDPAVKRGALSAALAAAASLAPSELVVIPHPTEPTGEAERFLAEGVASDGTPARVDREHGLHDVLHGAWLLVTASSQSVFDAVVSGVPAVTVNPTPEPDPVTFAAEGIAIGVRTDAEAAAAAAALRDPAERQRTVARQREALGDRLGPLDGRAAARAAAWLAGHVARAR